MTCNASKQIWHETCMSWNARGNNCYRKKSSLRWEIDSGQMQQALVNLVMNAIDSAPAGSTVILRSLNGPAGVSLEVENHGPAIPEPTRSKMFEPFFTTKPRGSGLGLAIARNI